MKSPTTLLIILIVLFSLVVSALSAQTQEVCAEGDCSPEILSVQLDFPLNVDTTYLPDQKRTEQYKAAYLKVKQIKNDQEQSPEWKIRYETNQ